MCNIHRTFNILLFSLINIINMLCYCYYVIIYSEFNKKPFGWLDLLNVCQTIINLLVCFGFCLNENTLKTENSTLLLLLNIYRDNYQHRLARHTWSTLTKRLAWFTGSMGWNTLVKIGYTLKGGGGWPNHDPVGLSDADQQSGDG